MLTFISGGVDKGSRARKRGRERKSTEAGWGNKESGRGGEGGSWGNFHRRAIKTTTTSPQCIIYPLIHIIINTCNNNIIIPLIYMKDNEVVGACHTLTVWY